MDALILSCSTGGGHNAAGAAVKEELRRRGHNAVMMDPYDLVRTGVSEKIGSAYIRIAQRLPRFFGFLYLLGEAYRRLPFRSPVYWLNGKAAGRLAAYLAETHYDVILLPHLFPAELLTYLKRHGTPVPPTIFIATDYTCIPFTEETDCDLYAVPAQGLEQDFIRRGIPEHKVIAAGIPVRRQFLETSSKAAAKKRLGLDENKRCLLLSGGSIGAGKLYQAIRILVKRLEIDRSTVLIVVCGNNRRLYEKLTPLFASDPRMLILESTEHMADYMRAADVFISKPGGLASTEAAVMCVPLVHISPVPGCETKNLAFFSEHGMCISVRSLRRELIPALERLKDPDTAAQMWQAQRTYIDPHAAETICDQAAYLMGKGD